MTRVKFHGESVGSFICSTFSAYTVTTTETIVNTGNIIKDRFLLFSSRRLWHNQLLLQAEGTFHRVHSAHSLLITSSEGSAVIFHTSDEIAVKVPSMPSSRFQIDHESPLHLH